MSASPASASMRWIRKPDSSRTPPGRLLYGLAGPRLPIARPAPVAQGIEHRPPEAGAQVRILPGAQAPDLVRVHFIWSNPAPCTIRATAEGERDGRVQSPLLQRLRLEGHPAALHRRGKGAQGPGVRCCFVR